MSCQHEKTRKAYHTLICVQCGETVKAQCHVCRRMIVLHKDGRLWLHGGQALGKSCKGSSRVPGYGVPAPRGVFAG